MLLKCDETRSGRLETKRRKQFWKQCAIKQQSSPLKALLWVLKGSSGPKNNWVDWQNRSSPPHRGKPLQCHAPIEPPLFRNFGTSNVPPALRCLHRSGFPVRHFWGCRQPLMSRNHSPERGLTGHPPRAASTPIQSTVTTAKAARAGTSGPAALCSHAILWFLKRSRLPSSRPQAAAFITWAVSSAALPELSNVRTDHSHPSLGDKRTYCPVTRGHRDHMRGRLGEISICSTELSQHLFLCL